MDNREYIAQELKNRDFAFTPVDRPVDCFPIEDAKLISVSGWEAFRAIGYQGRHIELTFRLADTEFAGEGHAQFQSLVLVSSTVMYASQFDRTVRYKMHDCRQINQERAFRNVRCPQNGVRHLFDHINDGNGYVSEAMVADLLGEEPTQRVLDTILKNIDNALDLSRSP